MEALFIKLLNMSITAGWLVLAVVVLRLVLKKAPKAMICALWALVAVRLIFPFSVESMFSLIPDPEPIQTQVVYEPQLTHSPEFLAGAILEEASASVGSAPKVEPASILHVVSNIWLAGMAVMFLYAVISYILVFRKTKEGVEQQKGVWLCDRIASPFILGIIKPRIFLPSSIDPADEEFVLAHERAHLKRLDHLWKPLGFLLLTVYWFNPLLWLAYILLCRDIELACDERVLRQLGIDCKQDYSTALINCSVPRRMISACPLAFGEVGVKGRIRSILNYKKPAFWLILIALIASVIVAVCFLTDPEKEQEPAEKGVTLEIVSQQADSLTVEWVNETDRPITVGYNKIYIEADGQWVESMIPFQTDYVAVMAFRGWLYELEPGETYQQIIYHSFVGATEPGTYLLEMEYTDGQEQKLIPIEFEVTQIVEDQVSDSPFWRIKLTCDESPDPLKPAIWLSDDGQFQFQFAGFSSYIARGTYEQTDEALILTTDDAYHYTYRFEKISVWVYRFDAANSAEIPQYSYDGVIQSPIPDGSVFSAIATASSVVVADLVSANIDSDDAIERCTVTYGHPYGMQAFEITVFDEKDRIKYRDVFQYEFLEISVAKNLDGDLQLYVVTRAETPEKLWFDISVLNGHIILTREREFIPRMETSNIS